MLLWRLVVVFLAVCGGLFVTGSGFLLMVVVFWWQVVVFCWPVVVLVRSVEALAMRT